MKIEIEGRADLRPVILAALDAGRFTVSMKTTPTPGGAYIEAETVFVDVLGVLPMVSKGLDVDGVFRPIKVPHEEIQRLTSERDALAPFADAVHEFAQACRIMPGDNVVNHLRGFSEDVTAGRVLVLHPDGYQSAVVGAEPPATFMDELTAANLQSLMNGVHAFALATIGPNEDGLENLQRWTDWARQGLVTVRRAGPPEIPRQAIREYLENQIEDEDEQMRVYGNVLSFIDEAIAGSAQVKPLRVERATTVQEAPPPEFLEVAAPEAEERAAYTDAERAAMLMRDDEPDSFERIDDDPAPALVKKRKPAHPIDDDEPF